MGLVVFRYNSIMKENTNIFSSQSLKEQEQQGQRVGGEQRDPDQDQQHQDQDPVQPEAKDSFFIIV